MRNGARVIDATETYRRHYAGHDEVTTDVDVTVNPMLIGTQDARRVARDAAEDAVEGQPLTMETRITRTKERRVEWGDERDEIEFSVAVASLVEY
jgi:hypothetical protein